MSVLSHSTTTILEAAASLVFILTYSFRIQIINFSVSWCCPHTHSHKHTVHQVLISCCHWSELEMKLYSCSLDNLDPQRGWLLKFEIWKLRETITQNHHLTSFSELCLPAHRCISLSGGRLQSTPRNAATSSSPLWPHPLRCFVPGHNEGLSVCKALLFCIVRKKKSHWDTQGTFHFLFLVQWFSHLDPELHNTFTTIGKPQPSPPQQPK